MVIPRTELFRNIPPFEQYSVKGGQLYVIHQTLHPLVSPRAFVLGFREQDPDNMQGKLFHNGERARAGQIKQIKFGEDEVVLKRVRYTVDELRRELHNHSQMKRNSHLQASLPIRQLVTYYDTVAEARKIVEKRGQRIEDVWPVEVPLAYYQADDGNDWMVFNYIPPAKSPTSGTEDVSLHQKAQTNPAAENLLWQSGAYFATDVEYVITGNVADGYRKVLVDTELLMRNRQRR